MKPADTLVSRFDCPKEMLCYRSSFLERLLNVGRYRKPWILFQRLEGNMSNIMALLRGPALGVIFMIILLAGVVLVTATAALVAQVGLVLRLKPWNAPDQGGNQRGPENTWSMPPEQSSAGNATQSTLFTETQRSPQVAVIENTAGEVIDADWWQEVR